MALQIFQIICNDKGDELFRFPKHTLLGNISLDLWYDILKYKYDGFRKMTKADVTDDFKKEFIGNINRKFNIHELENVSANIILIGECYLLINESKCYFSKNGTRTKIYVNERKITVKEYFSNYRKCNNIETFEASTILKQSKSNVGYSTFFIPII